ARSLGREVVRHARHNLERLVQLLLAQGGRRVEELPREPKVMLDQAVDQVHGLSPFGARRHEQASGWVEMNAVGRDEPEFAAVPTRRRAERSGKRPTEGCR